MPSTEPIVAVVVDGDVLLRGPHAALTALGLMADHVASDEFSSAEHDLATAILVPEAAVATVSQAVSSAGIEASSDSLLALAAVVAEAREHVRDGNVVVGATLQDLRWIPVAHGAAYRPVASAVETFTRCAEADAADSRDTHRTATWFAEAVGRSVASSFALPQDLLTIRLQPHDLPSVWGWTARAAARAAANGARLAVLLDPPEASHGWLARVVIVAPATDEIHDLSDPNLSLDDVDQRDLENLVALELKAARESAPIRGLFSQFSVALDGKTLLRLVDGVDQLQMVGIEVRAPKGLRRSSALRTSVSVRGQPVSMASELHLSVEVDLDGTRLSPADLRRLAKSNEPFVQFGSDWVRVPSNAQAAVAVLARAEAGTIDAADLLDEQFDQFDINAVDVSGWVGAALREEAVLKQIEPVMAPDGLQASLRHYQLDGLAWLTWCERNNLGGILADDMGLGKTVQLLSRVLADHEGPTLVVCPTTLIDNWLRESAKFTPTLRATTYHGTGRNLAESLAGADIVLTTYGLLGQDPALREVDWHRVILDEAQAIKTPTSKAAQAARGLRATHRFAVTGTPVENHLGDLWSLMAFAVPGLLGSFAKFRRRYLGAEATTDSDRIARLRTIVAPFMLRRTKHDKSVVPDLPDKIALRHDCALTREQIGIYEAIATKMEAQLGNASGTARRGMILAGLTRLKQACVHPQLARGTHENGLRTTSGKLTELIELATQAIDEGDALIVFTQYASFIAPLADYLAGQAQINSLQLHGSMSRSARTKAVDRFTDEGGPPVLLASLKAGGTGLNLVRASHVVHLDRWWNPAVEDQGSDRAWRIGQTSTVMVHSLVCPGTIEERIADVLARKRATASSISAPESSPAVTELSDEDLHDLVTLVRAETLLLRSS